MGLALVTIWYGPIVQAFLPGHTCRQRRNTTHALARLLYLSKAPNILLPFLSPYPHINPLNISSICPLDLVCVCVYLNSQEILLLHLHSLLLHNIPSSLYSSPRFLPDLPIYFDIFSRLSLHLVNQEVSFDRGQVLGKDKTVK